MVFQALKASVSVALAPGGWCAPGGQVHAAQLLWPLGLWGAALWVFREYSTATLAHRREWEARYNAEFLI